jgi:hypothetical protein
MTITKITAPIVKSLRKELQSNLQDIDHLENFEMTIGNASYSDSEVTFKLNVKIKGAKSREQVHLEQMAQIYKMDLDKIVTINTGEKVKLSGYNNRARKMPWQIQVQGTNSVYKISQKYAIDLFSSEYKTSKFSSSVTKDVK